MKAAIRLMWSLGLFLGALATSQAAITGTVKTIGGYGPGYVDGDNSVSQFNMPLGLAIDSQGHLYVADFLNNRIRVINVATEVTSTFASLGVSGPSGVALDTSGRVFVANFSAGNVRRYDPSGLANLLFASGLVNPVAVAVDNSGFVYVALQGGDVRRYTSAGVLDRTYSVTLGTPRLSGLAIAADGNVAVSDAGNQVIWQFAAVGGAPFQFAGTLGASGFADGGLNVGRFNSPQQIAVSTNGIMVVADQNNHRIRAVDRSGVISTLYGVDPANWSDPVFPGWVDGPAAEAELRNPVGVAVDNAGTVYDSEVFYDVIRKATSLSFPTNSNPGSVTNNPPSGTTGLNIISLGFEGGEGSSDFIAAPGQHFIAPVTLTVAPSQKMYGLQFNLAITNLPGAVRPLDYGTTFESLMDQPASIPGFFVSIPPALFVSNRVEIVDVPTSTPLGIVTLRVTNVIPVMKPMIIGSPNGDFLGIGWLERFRETNLYNTLSQDLITYSQAHNHQFLSSGGKVLVGGWGIDVPPNAPIGSKYQMRVGRPSANSDGVESDVVIDAPESTNNTARVSAVRILTIGVKSYLVGDAAPFRWFNAGDFGDNSLLNNDLEQLQQAFAYQINEPIPGSDLFDAMDSCCQDINHNTVDDPVSDPGGHQTSDNSVINSIAFGDGVLNLADLYVTFRRSLDPSLSNYVRFHTNGLLRAVPITNSFRGTAAAAGVSSIASVNTKKPAFDLAQASQPITARLALDSQQGRPGETIHVPLRLEVSGPMVARSILFRVVATGLSTIAPNSITFTPSLTLGAPSFSGSVSSNAYYAGWFERLSFAAGSFQLGTVDLKIPDNANADTAVELTLERAEVSAGLTTFATTTQNAFVVMLNRAPAPWADSIPDDWRVKFFGSLMDIASAPNNDADGDGVSNLDEFLAGTGPKDILSRLALRVQSGGNGSMILSWPSALGKLYRLESSTNLGDWAALEDGIAGTDGTLQRLRPSDTTTRFYRVHAH
jgi:hypothetical protein